MDTTKTIADLELMREALSDAITYVDDALGSTEADQGIYDADDLQRMRDRIKAYDDLAARLPRVYPSDAYHPVIGFDGEAHDTLERIIAEMRGYGVTLTLHDGSDVEAVLAGSTYDDETDRFLIAFYRVTDGNYPDISTVPGVKIESAFVQRVQVS